jgi:hypothetical protein
MAAQFMETQAEMLRVMARLQKQHVELATSVDLIQNAVGAPDAPDAPLPACTGGAAMSEARINTCSL